MTYTCLHDSKLLCYQAQNVTFSRQLFSLDVVRRLFQVSYSCIAAGSRFWAPSPVLADSPCNGKAATSDVLA